MPNDPTTESFPQPEIKLTDEVAPDLTAPPEPTPMAETPATIPSSVKKPFSVVTTLLLLISVGAIAATYFFYQQSKSLNTQLTQITQTQQQQQIKENQTIPIPTPTLTISETPAVTPSPTATASATGKVFDNIRMVITTAQKQYPNAQLIMIKTESFQNPTLATIKYWFRQNLADKKYLYVMAEPGKGLVVVDQQVTVAENILTPSLNQLAANSQLGIDLDEAVNISAAACPTIFDCTNSPVSGQYVKTNTTLWQISYKPINNSTPFVVQINATTKKILYKSL